MQHYAPSKQHDAKEIERLITTQSTCLLITNSPETVQCGVFNPIFHEQKLYLHLNRQDLQVKTMRSAGKAKIVFQDILAIIPSHWIDAHYGGAATTYYRYAELDCGARIIEDPIEMTEFLEIMMKRFQPEGRYDKLDHKSELYADSYETILVVEFKPYGTLAKWKLGQNRGVSAQRKIIAHLRARNQDKDQIAADEIERWIGVEQGGISLSQL